MSSRPLCGGPAPDEASSRLFRYARCFGWDIHDGIRDISYDRTNICFGTI